MKNKVTIRIILPFLLLLLLSSCGMRLKGAKHGDGGGIETFLVEGGITQYFIKPMSFAARHTSLNIDITMRGRIDSIYNAKANFTVPANGSGKIDSYKIVDPTTNATLLVANKLKGLAVGGNKRYFSEVNNRQLFDLLVSSVNFKIVVYKNGAEEVFSPTSKTIKKLKKTSRFLANDQ